MIRPVAFGPLFLVRGVILTVVGAGGSKIKNIMLRL